MRRLVILLLAALLLARPALARGSDIADLRHVRSRHERSVRRRDAQVSGTTAQHLLQRFGRIAIGDHPERSNRLCGHAAFRIEGQFLEVGHRRDFTPDAEGVHRSGEEAPFERGQRFAQRHSGRGIFDAFESTARVVGEMLLVQQRRQRRHRLGTTHVTEFLACAGFFQEPGIGREHGE